MDAEELEPSPAGASWLHASRRRFRHGFSQLLLAFQAIRRDRIAWKRYRLVCSLQAAVTVGVAAIFLATAHKTSEERREERVRKAFEQVAAVPAHVPPAALSAAHPAPVPANKRRHRTAAAPGGQGEPAAAEAQQDTTSTTPVAEAAPEDDTASEAAAAVGDFRNGVEELKTAVAELAKDAGETSVRRDSEFQTSRRELDSQLAGLQRTARGLPLTAEDRKALVQLRAQLDVLQAQTKPSWWDSALALVLSIYGTLSLVQAGVIALSRDYHAAIARDASLLLGVAPEDPPLVPRVRINVAWVRRKFKQRTRSVMVFLPGVGLLSLAAMPFPARATVTTVLTSAWAAYWWVVWTASKSARAWEREGVARPPWFLRAWHTWVAPLPVLGWTARTWEALWTRFTRPVFSPAEAVEEQPAEFVGLAAARALQLIPVVKLFVRPLVPVAAARLIAERTARAEHRLGSPQERRALAAQWAAVPASPSAIHARDEM
jgi:hypothetical protein